MSGINKSIDHGKGSSNATLLEKKIGFKKRTIDEINDDIDKTKNDIEECAALSAAMRKKRSTVEESAIPIVKEAFEEIENDLFWRQIAMNARILGDTHEAEMMEAYDIMEDSLRFLASTAPKDSSGEAKDEEEKRRIEIQ